MRSACMSLLTFVTVMSSLAYGQSSVYEAPASFYSSIDPSNPSVTLKSQLTALMSAGHTQSSYAEARDYLPFTDANPSNLTQMFEFYTHAVIQKPSASHVGFTGAYESREHVWPDSLQGSGNTSNSSRGSRGDIHMLKPLSQSVNSSRGNSAFAGATLTGSARSIGGSQWFPGTTDKGDAARIIFYGATRWSSTLSVVNGNPTTNTQMGDLASMLRFHYQDVPDTFELRRNDTIYRGDDIATAGDDSAFGGTRNRNAFIDRPEYVWRVFVDNANDTQLRVGPADVSGASTADLNFGRVLVNAPVPAAQPVVLSKVGVDGTYFSVTTTGVATSSIAGRYNAFAMDSTGSRSLSIGLTASTSTPGMKSGTVVINNLDVTNGGGAGVGANDADDVVSVHLAVLTGANPSFVPSSTIREATIDFGTYALGGTTPELLGKIYNRPGTMGNTLTAGLDFDQVTTLATGTGITLSAPDFTAMAADSGADYSVRLDSVNLGVHQASYVFNLSDEDLPGTRAQYQLSLSVQGRIALAGDANIDGNVNFNDLLTVASNYLQPVMAFEAGDFDRSGLVDFNDLLALARNYNSSASLLDDWTLAQSLVPETSCAFVAIFGLARLRCR